MKEKILIALCGMSPAVITETVYALAMKNNCPSKVIVVTTTLGREKIKEDILDSGIWSKLCKTLKEKIDFGFSSYHIRLIPKPDAKGDAEDILSTLDNNCAADFILSTLREFTENPDTEIVLSIAGGRKTMSSIGALAMSLLGREEDTLCHVLVNTPFDSPSLIPKFFFPLDVPIIHRSLDDSSITSADAKITLCDIPFPRLRYLFQNEFQRLPGGFNDTVTLANQRVSGRIPSPDLRITPERMEISFDNKLIKFNCAEFLMYWMLTERARNSMPQIHGQASLLEEFISFTKDITYTRMPEIIHHKENILEKSDDDVRKLISAISAKIRKHITLNNGRDACLPSLSRGLYSVSLPPESIIIIG